MTVITVTAVGFREVHPLSELGQDFTMGLLAAGITGVGIWFALITSFIVEFDLGHVRRKRWRARMLQQLDGHVVLFGGGTRRPTPGSTMVTRGLCSGNPIR